MATTMTLSELQTAVRQRADMVNSTFVTDAELTSYIHQSAYELYDVLITKYGNDYFTSSTDIATNGTSTKYSLPTDFYKLLGVDLLLSANADSYITLKPFTFSDRNRYSVPNLQSFYGVTNLRYRLNGDQLWMTPTPSAGQTLRVYYVPRMTALSAGSDKLEGVSGWTEYVIVDAVIKCKLKEESDASAEMALKAALLQRITDAASSRDAGSPAVVVDTQWNEGWWPNPGGYGGGGIR
jgi:hypothetical protein